MAFNVEVLSFSDWATAWSEPAAADVRGACLFQSPSYISIWLDTIGRARRTTPVFLRVDTDDARRVMLLALGLERQNGIKTLTFLDGGVVDYTGPVRLGPAAGAIDADGARVLWAALCDALPSFDVAVLEKMPLVVEGVPNPFRHLAQEAWPSGWAMQLSGGFDDYRRDSNYAATNRRKRRQLQHEVGPVSFEVARDPPTARRFLATMVAQKARKYPGSFQHPGYDDYFPQLTDREDLGGSVHVSALMAGDNIVASHWGLVCGDTFYYMMPAYDTGTVSRFFPGRLLLEDLIGWCYENGIRSFDFGHGDEAYKPQWGARRRPLLWFETSGSLVGRAAVAALTLRRSRTGKRLERVVRRLAHAG